VRVAAILHPYAKDSLLEPFRSEHADLFRGNMVEPGDLPGAVIVFGGDGSVHRVIQSLAGSGCPLLVVPTGSGNDFAESIGIRTIGTAIVAWHKFLETQENARTIDLGVVTPLSERVPLVDEHAVPVSGATYIREDGTFDKPEQALGSAIMRQHLHHLYDSVSTETYFCCVVGAGLDSETNRRANNMPAFLRANGGYVIGAMASLFSYRQQAIKISLPDEEGNFRARVSEPALLAAIGNAPSYGRGMRITTDAQLDDGLLDVCFVRRAGRWRVLRLMHTVFHGEHLSLPEVEYFRAKELWIESETPLAIYGDGEYICDTPAEVRVRPNALKVIVP
jgi:diacylglycerol kinase (ATP)